MNVVELSGGVGGARLARGLAGIPGVNLTAIVNVGDDSVTQGLHISPDLDTVIYTLAGEEGPHGWGRAGDTFRTNDELARFGIDNRFKLGDLDLALKVFRTAELAAGTTLSEITLTVAKSFGLHAVVLPATDDELRTFVRLEDGWVSFKEYFVERGHRDDVKEIRFEGSADAEPAPGVIQSIEESDLVVIGPSNPPLSIWPILAVPSIREAIAHHPRVAAVSPLIGGATIKGPADRVLRSLGLGSGTNSVANSYGRLIDCLYVDESDVIDLPDVNVIGTDTMIQTRESAIRLAQELIAK
jgi:LPPG:FO 2-phospho-L-lactate transferase